MDGEWFAAMARTLAAGSRRAAIRALVVSELVAGLARLGPAEAAACKAVTRKCDRNRDCCSRKCKQGTCRCRKPLERCTQASDCCGTSTTCGLPGACGEETTPRCCRILNAPCTSHCECCDDLSACHGGRCCRPLGAPCSHSNSCCSGHCVAGSCAP